MKSTKKSLFFLPLSAVLVLLAGTACSPSGSGEDSSQALKAFPENADIAIYFDQKAMGESEFSEAIREMQDEFDQPEGTEEMANKFKEITGLDDDEVTEFVLAISGLENVQIDPSLLLVSGAVSADEVVTAEQIVEAIKYVAEQNGESVELTLTVGEGADIIEFPKNAGAPEMISAVVTGTSSTTAFFGDRGSVDASLARSVGSVPSALAAPSKGLIEGQQGWISIIIPESMKAQLAGMAAQGEQMAPGLSKIESLESVGVGMKATDSLAMVVGFNLGSDEDAQAIANVLNNQLISFARMMLSGSTPEPMPVLNSLTAANVGSRATLSLVLTIKDIEIVQAQLLNFLPGMGVGGGVTPSVQ